MKKLFNFRLLVLIGVLIMSIPQVKADITFSGGYVYFDNTNTEFDDGVIELVAHQWTSKDYIGCTTMDLISGTNNLYYVKDPNGSNWGGIWGWRIMSNGSAWGSGDNSDGSVQKYSGNCTGTSTTGLTSGYSYLCYGASSTKNSTFTVSSLGNSDTQYTSLNYSQTLYQCVAENGGTPAKSTASIGTISITTKKLNGRNSTTDSNGNITSGQNNVAKDAARTATVTMEATSIADGYTFLGWYDAETSGTRLEASTTYEYEASAAKTVYARFSHETTHSVDITYKCGATTVSTATSQAIGQVTASDITAPTVAGYTFSSWSLGNGVADQGSDLTANPISVKTLSSGTYTMQANYTEDLTSPWTLKGGTNLTGDNWATEHALTKKTGHSTESVAYYTFSISSTNSGISGSADAWSFKVKNGDTWYGLAADGDSYWWQSNTTADQSLSSSGKNIQVCANVAGSYEVKVDYSSNPITVTVTFPTSYTLTYDIGTVKGNDGSISSSPSTASGSKVLSGSTVTLTAPDAKTGYTWKGWYLNSDGSGVQQEDDQEYAVTVSANTTLYACYTENINTVTVNAGSGGKVSYNGGVAGSSCSASAGVATASATISAIPNTGYAFVGWTNVDKDHHITNYTATWNSTNNGWDLVVNADDNTTITANFAPRFALVGAIDADDNPEGGMPGWDLEDAVAFSYSTGTYTISRTLTSPNTTYAFKVIDRRAETWIWRGHSSSTNNLAVDNTTTYTLTENGGNNVYFDSRGVGSYTFTVVEETIEGVIYPKVKIQDGANSHVVTWGYVSDNGQEGGTITSVVDGEATPNNIASGKYVKDGGSITATAEANDGYRFIDFRTSSTYGGGDQLSTDNPYTVASVNDDQNIYAHFAENLCTVTITTADASKGSITVGGKDFDWGSTTQVGVYNYKSLVVNPAAGYYFSGWTLSDTPDFTVGATGESGSSTNLTGLGGTHGSTGTLTANFEELDKIYFRNENETTGGKLWDEDNIYVYFNVGWAEDGEYAGVNSLTTNAEMNPLSEGSKIFWAYVPRAVTTSNNGKIAFSDVWMGTETYPGGTYTKFYLNNGVYRTDYNTNLNMYVPASKSNRTSNSTVYYDDGFWMKYETSAGQGASYYLKKGTGGNEDDLSEFKVSAANGTSIVTTYRFESTSAKTFYIANAAGNFYKATSAITAAACTDVVMGADPATQTGFSVTPSSEGIYTFTIDQSGDTMKITVDYPATIGDYRLKYVGNGNTHYSDVIKKGDTDKGAVKVSMYIDKAATSPSLKLERLNSIAAGVQTWGERKDLGFTGFGTKNVYVMDLTVSGTNGDASTLSNVAAYDGPFYIKTDASSGGWADYTKNVLHENDITYNSGSPATGFNYYYCSHANGGTNVKCVIANDYSNQISDTLKSDAILGAYAANHEEVIGNTNVRFSYNSNTNTLERAYLSSVYGTDVSKVLLKPTAESLVYDTAHAGTPANDIYSKDTYLKENGNWTYALDVDVYPSGNTNASVQTRYPASGETGSAIRTLASAIRLMGSGDAGSTAYRVQVTYDFKTNYLSSAFIRTSATPIDETINLYTDYVYVRAGAGESTQLSFSGEGQLSNVKKVYGVFEFKKDSMVGAMSSWTANDYRARRQCRYYFSFPFDVNVKDIFGVGEYGVHYIIQMYNGAKRAEIGWFQDTPTFWETLTIDSVLHARQGYALMLDREAFNDGSNGVWTNIQDGGSTYLYFPSTTEVNTISGASGTFTVPAHTCTIDRVNATTKKAHSITDSNWNLLGLSTYGDVYQGASGEGPSSIFKYNPSSNGWTPATVTASTQFLSMYAYMVQWAGTFSWRFSIPASVAARHTAETKNKTIQLNLMQDGEEKCHAFVKLNEEASADFVLNEDMSAIINSGVPNIYTYAGVYDVAYNEVPEENQIIPVGVVIRKAGTYSFSIPENINGTVTLIDEFEQTRTNLSISDYEVSLPKGTINDRFFIEINVNKVTTAIEDVSGDGTDVDGKKTVKFLQDDQLFILRDGKVYDATGALVK